MKTDQYESEQDLLTLFTHPVAAAAGALLNNDHHPSDNGFIMKTDQSESELSLVCIHYKSRSATGSLFRLRYQDSNLDRQNQNL